MSDPKRLADAGDLGASLLCIARTDDAERARARKAALIGAGAATTAIAAARVLPKAAWKIALGKWVLLGVVACVSAGIVAMRARRPDPPPRAKPIAALVWERAKLVEAPIAALIEAPADLEIDLDVPVDPIAPRPSPIKAPRGTAKPAAPPTIAEEAALLRAARGALAANDAARALAALDVYDRRFPQGALHIEAELLRIEALARSGDESAASRSRRFANEHPDTPYAQRARALSIDGGAAP